VATSDRTRVGELGGTRKADFVARWFYGAPNLVGAVLAIGVVGLFLGGLISGPLVPAIAAGSYLVGALATPRPRGLRGHTYEGGLDSAGVRDELAAIERQAGHRLPAPLATKVASIATTIREMLPLIETTTVPRDQLFAVDRTVSDYLPTALDNFLRLPRTYATTHVVVDGKTSADLLGEQLDLIDEKMHEISTALAKDDVGRLLAQGRFLEDRFGRHERLDVPSGEVEQTADSLPAGEAAARSGR
jgi:hypothetical protein